MHFEKKMAALQQDSRQLSSLKLGITHVFVNLKKKMASLKLAGKLNSSN